MEHKCECEHARSVSSVEASAYGDRYKDHVLEQYKVFLEGMEKNSERRRTVLQFFIGANTAIFALVGFTFDLGSPLTKLMARLAIAAAGVVVCIIFFYLFRSHKQLSSAKFRVIEQIEELLPLKPYSCEWSILKKNTEKTGYLSSSKLEALLTLIFGAGFLMFAALSYCAYRLS